MDTPFPAEDQCLTGPSSDAVSALVSLKTPHSPNIKGSGMRPYVNRRHLRVWLQARLCGHDFSRTHIKVARDSGLDL